LIKEIISIAIGPMATYKHLIKKIVSIAIGHAQIIKKRRKLGVAKHALNSSISKVRWLFAERWLNTKKKS